MKVMNKKHLKSLIRR